MTLYDAAGARITKAAFPATADTDPVMVVDENVYERVHVGPQDPDPEGSITRLLMAAGASLRQSEIDLLFPAVVVTSITPDTGPAVGGTAVTIRGKNLSGVTAVTFDGAAGTSLQVLSPTELTVVTPAGAAGPADVAITSDAGTVTETGGFTYA